MSEEEILNIMNKLGNIYDELKKDDEEGHSSAYEMQFEDFEAIQGLLDLYNKEKEKNKRYEKYLKTKEEKYEKILEYIETEIEQDYISKDKVKECLDDIIDYFDNPSIPDEDNQFLEKKKKELLEEEE